jgi:hypothetical protein
MSSEYDDGAAMVDQPRASALSAPPAEPNELLPSAVVRKQLCVSRETLLRWMRNWRAAIARGERPADLLGRPKHFPPHTHVAGSRWKRWDRRTVDAWVVAQRARMELEE